MRKFVAVLITGLLAGAAVACTNGASSETPPTSTPPSTRTVAPGLQNTPDPQTGGEPQQGGTFTLLWSDPPSLDPALITDTTSASLAVEIFSGLVSLDADMQIVPELAESWDVEGDGTIYQFRLRNDLVFSNGDPVTASDFKWSMERAAHPDTGSPVADIYLGDIVGMQEIFNGDGSVTEASGIEVIDEHTLRITIDSPKAYFLAKLTSPTAFVLNRENVESGGDNWADNAVSTGPFRLEEYRIGQSIVLERNDNYWGQKAHLDSVVYNLSGGVAMAMYENDEIDVTGVSLADRDRVQDPSDPLNQHVVSAPPQFSVSYIGFHMDQPPFDDPRFRQALNHAANKELIADRVFFNLARPAYSILPPGFPGYSEDIQGLTYDPGLAQQLLSESSYADPASRPRIVLTVPGTGGSPAVDISAIVDLWQTELGVTVEIQQVEWATYLQDLHSGRLQAWGGLGWQADYPDPQDFIDVLFHSESAGNNGAYSNQQVDDLVEQARVEQDASRRMELYNEAEQIIVNDAAWLPLWFDTEAIALVKPHVKNYRFPPITVPKMKDVYIQQ